MQQAATTQRSATAAGQARWKQPDMYKLRGDGKQQYGSASSCRSASRSRPWTSDDSVIHVSTSCSVQRLSWKQPHRSRRCKGHCTARSIPVTACTSERLVQLDGADSSVAACIPSVTVRCYSTISIYGSRLRTLES